MNSGVRTTHKHHASLLAPPPATDRLRYPGTRERTCVKTNRVSKNAIAVHARTRSALVLYVHYLLLATSPRRQPRRKNDARVHEIFVKFAPELKYRPEIRSRLHADSSTCRISFTGRRKTVRVCVQFIRRTYTVKYNNAILTDNIEFRPDDIFRSRA